MANLSESNFYCTKCGTKGISIQRTKNKRQSGHLKKLYCLICKQEVNSVEIRENVNSYNLDDFYLEFNYHNFTIDGERKEPFNQFKLKLYKEGVI